MKGQKKQGTNFGSGNMLSERIVFAFAFVAVIGWIGSTSLLAQTNSPPAEQIFKNIQAFKGLPADQVLPMMQFISGSLGVHCGHCHHQEEAKRDDDGKPQKLMARKMVQMVSDINKTTFGGRKVVSCYTCHRGSTKVARPVAFEEGTHSASAAGQEASPSGAGVNPTADQIVDRYVASIGGADAISKVASLVQKGTMAEVAPGEKPTTMLVEILAKAPAKYAAVTHVKNGDAIGLYNGGTGWFLFSGSRLFLSGGRLWDFQVPFEPVRAMRGDELEAAQLGDPLYLAGRLKQLITGLRTSGTEKLGDQETYVISGRTKNLSAVKLYFYQESGLLARLTYDVETPLGPIPHQIDYSDYRDVGGVRVAFQWTAGDIREPRYIYKMTEVHRDVPIDESKFAKPSVAPAVP